MYALRLFSRASILILLFDVMIFIRFLTVVTRTDGREIKPLICTILLTFSFICWNKKVQTSYLTLMCTLLLHFRHNNTFILCVMCLMSSFVRALVFQALTTLVDMYSQRSIGSVKKLCLISWAVAACSTGHM